MAHPDKQIIETTQPAQGQPIQPVRPTIEQVPKPGGAPATNVPVHR